MKVLKWIGIILVSLVIIFLIISLIMPKEFSVEKSITIDASKEKVFNHLASFEKFSEWSPWAELDSNMTYEISGEDGTEGAVYEWEGNEDVGKGKMRIDHISGMDSIAQTLTFLEPYESEAKTYYTIEETPEGVKASWGFKSSVGIPMNVFMVMGGMEEMVGKDFSKGLKKLKQVVESEADAPYEVEELQMKERTYLVKKDKIKFSNFTAFYEEAFSAVYNTVTSLEDVQSVSMPTGIFYTWDQETETTEMAAGMQINNPEYVPEAPLTTVKVGPGTALRISYYGAYAGSGAAHNYMEQYIKANGYDTTGAVAMEEYITDPESEPDTSKWLTNIYYVFEQ